MSDCRGASVVEMFILKFLQYYQNSESMDADYEECFKKSHEMPICEEWIYRYTISYADFDLDWTKGKFKKMYANATDLVRVQFYYATLSYSVVEEKLRFSVDDLISSIGGQMGLWLGISLISFYDWAVILLRWWRNRKHAGVQRQ